MCIGVEIVIAFSRNKIANMYRCIIRRTLITSHVQRQTNEELSSELTVRAKTPAKKRHSYSETILLPRTKFRVQLNRKERIEKDAYLTTVSIRRPRCIVDHPIPVTLMKFSYYFVRTVVSTICTSGKGRIFRGQTLSCTTGLLMQMEFHIWGMLSTRFKL